MHIRIKNKSKRKTFKTRSKGGKAIGSGAYGCVFKPALKCEGETSRPDGMISKLMETEDAEQEHDLVRDIIPRIETIPNYQDYFIVGGNLCEPSPLVSPEDELHGECNSLKDIHKINRNLSNYRILNSLDGGIDLDKYIRSRSFDSKKFSILNDGLIRLLKFGIVPMNEAGVLHLDVKGDNILIDSQGKCRLIDWGLAIVYDQPVHEVHQDLDEKAVQFNLPLGVLLFNSLNQRRFERGHSTVLMNVLAGNGHYKVMQFYSDLLDKNKTSSDKEVAINMSAPAMLVDLWNEYRDRDSPELEYFNEVFKYNADIYGLLTVYLYIYEHFPRDIIFESSFKRALIKRLLRNFLITYIFSDTYAKTRYNVDEIIQKLNELSVIANATESDIFYLTRKNPQQLGTLSFTPDSEISEIIARLIPATTGGNNRKKYARKTRKLTNNKRNSKNRRKSRKSRDHK